MVKQEHFGRGTAWEEIKWNYTGSVQISVVANEGNEEGVNFSF